MLPSEIQPSSALTLYMLFSSTTFSLLDLHCFQKTCESVIASIDTPTIAGSCKVVFLCVIPAVLQKQEWLIKSHFFHFSVPHVINGRRYPPNMALIM